MTVRTHQRYRNTNTYFHKNDSPAQIKRRSSNENVHAVYITYLKSRMTFFQQNKQVQYSTAHKKSKGTLAFILKKC